ncbi:MAG: VacJ family lipoprotein [Paracoccaceae bacterium]
MLASFYPPEKGRAIAGMLMLAILAACGPAPAPQGINDPAEGFNRSVHGLNLALDRAFVRPASEGYGHILPQPVRTGVSNFASNLNLPGEIVNGLLQGRVMNATENTLRFAVNTIAGVGGIFDPATVLGVKGKRTDFGETLHVWGVGEGPYLEMPGMGPTTARDLTGTVVDVVMNPVSMALDAPEKYWSMGIKAASKLGDRYRYSDTIDSILYESADSYAQARLLYLQNRRYELGQSAGSEAAFEDPYEDPYAQ